MGLIHDEPTVAELFERIVAEAKEVQEKLAGKMA
jgi:chorismate mutase